MIAVQARVLIIANGTELEKNYHRFKRLYDVCMISRESQAFQSEWVLFSWLDPAPATFWSSVATGIPSWSASSLLEACPPSDPT